MIDIFNASNMYILSDIHFFHNNICKYCKRPYNYEDKDEIFRMNNDILEKFKTLPDTNDTVIWNLGDISFGRMIMGDKDAFDKLKSLVSIMKGENRTLCLILGNHDFDVYKAFRKKVGKNNVIDFYKEIGFDFVYNKPILFNEKIILSHEPVFLGESSIFYNVHGHTHDVNVDTIYFKNIEVTNENSKTVSIEIVDQNRYINVCLDANNMEIIDFKKIIRELK